MQEMHGKECEGRFLGVKLDSYSASGARLDREEVDMQHSLWQWQASKACQEERISQGQTGDSAVHLSKESLAVASMQPNHSLAAACIHLNSH